MKVTSSRPQDAEMSNTRLWVYMGLFLAAISLPGIFTYSAGIRPFEPSSVDVAER